MSIQRNKKRLSSFQFGALCTLAAILLLFYPSFLEYLSAVGAQWVALMSGIVSLGFGLYERIKGKYDERVFYLVAAACLVLAAFFAWREQYVRDQGQITYIELDTSQTGVPSILLFPPGDRASFNFGRNNSGSYRADDIYGASALEIFDASGKPTTGTTGQMWLTSPSLEKKAWGRFLQTHPGPYAKSMMTPGRVGLTFTTAISDHVPPPEEIKGVNAGEKVMYVMAFVVWTDAAGTHERHRCQFFHFPPAPSFVLEDCYGFNDFLGKAIIK